MLRLDAVRSILFDQIAGLHSRSAADQDPLTALAKARRRAAVVAVADWIAILALFLLRSGGAPFLAPGPTQEGLFTLGVLAVATHSGFRLGQLEKYAAVGRALEQLPAEARLPAPNRPDD